MLLLTAILLQGLTLAGEPARIEQVAWLQGAYPDALLNTYIKEGNSRWREQKWLGSYRYAVLNLGGRDRQDMFAHFEHICHHLRFETTRDIHVGGYVAEVRPK